VSLLSAELHEVELSSLYHFKQVHTSYRRRDIGNVKRFLGLLSLYPAGKAVTTPSSNFHKDLYISFGASYNFQLM